uniref:Uncharacterized protein n=1 Tax=Macrostomum lignano TaxID=282301 RepID=A0A1I8F6H6_9PLAT
MSALAAKLQEQSADSKDHERSIRFDQADKHSRRKTCDTSMDLGSAPMRKEDELKDARAGARARSRASRRASASTVARERRRRDERALAATCKAERRFEDDQFKVDEIVQADEEVLVDEDVRHQIDLFDDKVLEDREASEIKEELPPMRKEDELKAPERSDEREAARVKKSCLVSTVAANDGRRDERARRRHCKGGAPIRRRSIPRSTRLFRPTKKVLVDEDVRHQIDLFDD